MVLLRKDQVQLCNYSPTSATSDPYSPALPLPTDRLLKNISTAKDPIAAFKKRNGNTYAIKRSTHFILATIHILYAIATAVLAPFFHKHLDLFPPSNLDGSRSGNFPLFSPAQTQSQPGVISDTLFYTFNPGSNTITTEPLNASLLDSFQASLSSTVNNNVLYTIDGIAIFCAFAGAPLYVLAGRKNQKVSYLLADIVLKVVALVMHVLLLSRPTIIRMIIMLFLSATNVLHLIPVLYITHHVWSSGRRRGLYLRYPATNAILGELEKLFPSSYRNNPSTTPSPLSPISPQKSQPRILSPEANNILGTVDHVDRSLEFRSIRSRMYRKYQKGSALFILLTTVLVGLTLSNFTVEFIKIMNSQGEFLPYSVVTGMNANRQQDQASFIKQTASNFPNNAVTENKVIILLLDGLRLDYSLNNNAMKELFNDPDIAKDMKNYDITCQLPSMSLPNWLSIMTGSPPEVTGLLNNIAAPETKFDSIFNRVKQANWLRGATGSPTLPALIRSALPKLIGDGSVDPAFGAKGSMTTAFVADRERLDITMQAISGTTREAFKLFLAHFSDIDIQGHSFGVKPAYNLKDTYNDAVTEKARAVKQILGSVDTNTVVIILSDHGQVDAGGHGGASDDNMMVPLIAYKKGSGFRDFIGVDLFPPPYTNLDVAATVTSLLGLSAPAQTQGRIITSWMDKLLPSLNATEARRLAVKDLFRQKQNYVFNLLNVMGVSFNMEESLIRNTATDPANYPAEAYASGVDALMQIYEVHRYKYFLRIIIRNTAIHLMMVILIVSFNIWVMERYTFSFPMRIFQRASNTRNATSANLESGTQQGHLRQEEKAQADADLKRTIAKNRRAFWATGGVIAIQIVTSALIFFLYYWMRGYGLLDSTILHHPKVLPEFISALLVTSIVMQIVVSRLFVLLWANWSISHEDKPFWKSILLRLRMLFSNKKIRFHDIQMVYLLKVYALFWTNVAVCLCFLLLSTYTFVIPLTFESSFIVKSTWAFRFRILSLECMCLPILLGHLFGLVSWPSESLVGLDKNFMDPIYEMGVLKLHMEDAKHRQWAMQNSNDVDDESEDINEKTEEISGSGHELNGEEPSPRSGRESPDIAVILPHPMDATNHGVDISNSKKDGTDGPKSGLLIGECYSVFRSENQKRYGKMQNMLDAVWVKEE